MRKAQFFYLLRRGLLSGGLNFIKEGLVMASKFITQGLSFPAQGSAEFNGTSDYIQTNTPFSYTNHTIAGWCYVDDNALNKFVFDNRDGNDDGIRVFFATNEVLYYSVNAADINSGAAQPLNEWLYFSATYNGTTAKLYIDGSLSAELNTSQTTNTTTNARIGSTFGGNDYYKGNLANVAIWNRALSSDEINSVMWKSYEALSGAESNGLQAWYSLDDISSPAASLANMEQLATDKNATIENKAAVTAAINALS